MPKGRSTGPAAMSCGTTAAKKARSDGSETKTVIKLLKRANVSVAAAGAVAADWDVDRPCSACGTAEKACCADETALWASPAVVLAAWPTAAVWFADDVGSVFCCGCWNGDSVVADAEVAA